MSAAITEADVALVQSLVGCGIVRADWADGSPNEEWSGHERAWLWLDDGRIVEFAAWGFDAWGATVAEVRLVDVAVCLNCGREHLGCRVWGRDGGDFQAYCADGNHAAWVEQRTAE